MNNNVLILSLVAICVTAAIAVHFANKGNPVRIGSPFLKAEIN